MAIKPIRSVTKNITPAGTNYVLLDDGVAMGKATLTDAVSTVAGPLADTKIAALSLDTASQKAVEFFATAAQGATADSAVQPGDLGDLAAKDKVGVGDIDATGTANSSSYLRGDGSWSTPAGGGDMLSTNDLSDLSSIPTARSNMGLSTSLLQGRLTLTDGVAFPTADVTGATTIYYVPAGGQFVPVFDGTQFNMRSIGSGLSLPLDSDSGHTRYQPSGNNIDLFVFDDAGTLRLGSSVIWSSDTSRGTGTNTAELENYGGVLVNKVTAAIRFDTGTSDYATVAARQATYVGSFRPTANGQASDTMLKRFLFNAYNQAARKLYVSDAVGTYQYKDQAFRQFNGNAANKVEILLGLDGIMVTAVANGVMDSSNATPLQGVVGIGLDSATTTAGDDSLSGFIVSETAAQSIWAHYKGYPGIGYHYLAPLERGGSSLATDQRWYGNNSGAFLFRPGLAGEFFG